MDTHSVFHNVTTGVIVAISQEAEEVSMILHHHEAVEPRSDSHGFFPEPHEYTQQAVVEIGACEENIIEEDSFEWCT